MDRPGRQLRTSADDHPSQRAPHHRPAAGGRSGRRRADQSRRTPLRPKAKPPVKTESWPELVFIDVGGGYHFNTFDVSETRTEPYFAETKSWTASYSLGNAPTFAFGGGVRAWHNLVVAATFTSFKDEEPSNITGSVPNPFFFNKPRSFSGTSDPLTHQEQTVHVSAIWRVRVSPKLEVGVGGGPSFISLQQDFVKDVEFTEHTRTTRPRFRERSPSK